MWLALIANALLVAGCGNDYSQTAEAMPEQVDLTSSVWQVEDIDLGGIIDSSHITIDIPEPTRIAGSAGCNQYFGTLELGTSTFQVSAVGSTKKSCAPALNLQEQRFLQALQSVTRFTVDDVFLRLYDEQQQERIRAVRSTRGTPPPQPLPADEVGQSRNTPMDIDGVT